MPAAALEADDLARLVERAAGGDRVATTQLYRAQCRAIALVVYRILGDDAELDDIVQDTFTEGFRALGQLQDPQGLRSWLTTIAVRKTKRRLAQRYRHRDALSALRHHAPAVSDPAKRDNVETLYRALDRLSADLRVPWILHRIEGETLPAVAKLCQTSLTTVKRRIAKAERRLSRRLNAR